MSSNEILNLSDKYKIVEIKCPKKWVGHSIEEIGIRKKYYEGKNDAVIMSKNL